MGQSRRQFFRDIKGGATGFGIMGAWRGSERPATNGSERTGNIIFNTLGGMGIGAVVGPMAAGFARLVVGHAQRGGFDQEPYDPQRHKDFYEAKQRQKDREKRERDR